MNIINPFNVGANSAGRYTGFGKFGYNPAVATAEESIWDQGGIYGYLSSAEVLSISSSDAADTAAGTGARTVDVYGLDANLLSIQERVTLNGQTAVSTTAAFLRVFRMIVRSAGSGGENAGDLYAGTGTVTAGVPANVFAKMTAGRNQTLMCVWTVPADKSAYLTGVFVSSQGNSSTTAIIRLVVRPLGEVFQTKYEFIVSQAGGPLWVPFPVPGYVPGSADVEIRATSGTGTIDVSAALGFMIG